MINMNLEAYLVLLGRLDFSKFIVLHRKNYLRRIISEMVGRKVKRWHYHKTMTVPTKVNIDIESVGTGNSCGPLLESFRCLDENYNLLQKVLSGDEVLYLFYEDDILKDPTKAYRQVCDFLGITCETPEVPLKKTNPFSYEEIVTNFDEISSCLEGTEYAWMLDD